MQEYSLPSAFQEIFESVYEEGDRVLSVGTTPPSIFKVAPNSACLELKEWNNGESTEPHDLVFFLDVLPKMTAANAGGLHQLISLLVRPGGMLFVTALSADHESWLQPGAGWLKSGTRELSQPSTNQSRFFLFDDEVVTLFAAWNILHHQEFEDGRIEVVFLKPEGRTVDVSTVLYGG